MFRPLTCAVILSAIAKPAASSAALLIFLPEDSLSIAVLSSAPDLANDLCAFKDATFVFMTKLITKPLKFSFRKLREYGFNHNDPNHDECPAKGTPILRNLKLLACGNFLPKTNEKRQTSAVFEETVGCFWQTFRFFYEKGEKSGKYLPLLDFGTGRR
jgi:hypothetical protein